MQSTPTQSSLPSQDPATLNSDSSHDQAAAQETFILAVDCGGGALKSAVCDVDGSLLTEIHRQPVHYPFSSDALIDHIATRKAAAATAGMVIGKVGVGIPGMIRSGRIIYTPHYIRTAGPHTEIVPDLEAEWNGLDVQALISERFNVSVRVVNDSEMHGAALIRGEGLELALTFGTGLGSAHFSDGTLQAHLEMSHAPFLHGGTYDQYIGDHVRREIGNDAWSHRIVEVVEALYPVYRWDAVFIGGGNAHNLSAWALERLTEIGPYTRVVANRVALSGAAGLWQH
ncbi:ROK family protein [Jonesia quinghaiensis]|uniref:ROK family protein n=1 Tax=Jonesia quinghaiensis TaxID=262806 RepID=UPI000409703D|nr:ROK family protein [Jonesia quinghaiensis]